MFRCTRLRSWRYASRLALSVLGVAGVAGPALAGREENRAPVPQMVMGATALPPIGFLDFCQRVPEECLEAPGKHTDVAAIKTAVLRQFWQTTFSRFVTQSTQTRPAALGAPDVSGFGRGARHDTSNSFAGRGAISAISVSSAEVEEGQVNAPTQTSAALSSAGTAIVLEALSADSVTRSADGQDATAVGWSAAQAAADTIDALPSTAALPSTEQARTQRPSLSSLPVTETSGPGQAATPVGTDLPAGDAPFSLDRTGWHLVNGINRRINRQIRRADDSLTYGAEDYWTLPQGKDARGDCEDFVLAKRRALIDAGVPPTALSIAIVDTQWGESHAVLLISAVQGEYVLDSLSPWVSRWDRVNYVWRERQVSGHPFEWVQAAL